jgi:peptide/nickel transport system permease protein
MKKFVVRRVIGMLMVLFGVSFLTYGMLFLAPGDPAELILRAQEISNPTEAQIDAFREEKGLNDPFYVQYGRWLSGAIRGDFGRDYLSGASVTDMIVTRVPQTAKLAVSGMVLALLIAIPAGVISAVHQNKLPDYATQIGSLIGVSMPNFWLGYLLIIFFAVNLSMLPVAGTGSLSHLVLPAATLGTGMAAVLTRLLRASMLEVLDQEYVKTARSKGLPERIVVYKHALRNALLPILTVVGLSFGALLNGTVIVEVVFQRPGLGLMFIDALLNRNYPVVLASVVLAASIFVVVNTIVDITYRYVDPRIELERRPA